MGAHGERSGFVAIGSFVGIGKENGFLMEDRDQARAHGRGIGAMDMGCVARVRREWRDCGWAQGNVAVGRMGLARRNGMGVVVAMGAVAMEKVLPVEDLWSQSVSLRCGNRSILPELTIQATGMAQPGMFSLQ